MAETKPIHLVFKDASVLGVPLSGNSPQSADGDAISSSQYFASFAPLAAQIHALTPPILLLQSVDALAAFLDAAQLLDGTYGEDGVLPVEDVTDAADEAIRALADLQTQLHRLNLGDQLPIIDKTAIGIGLWCMRHQVAIYAPEPIVNALARLANAANSRQETAAAYALMQGFLVHIAPQFAPDLERSNPERPWRMLNINFAIVAIRTGDSAMMRYAFDALNQALPDECAAFYSEAVALIANQPGFPIDVHALITIEQRRFEQIH